MTSRILKTNSFSSNGQGDAMTSRALRSDSASSDRRRGDAMTSRRVRRSESTSSTSSVSSITYQIEPPTDDLDQRYVTIKYVPIGEECPTSPLSLSLGTELSATDSIASNKEYFRKGVNGMPGKTSAGHYSPGRERPVSHDYHGDHVNNFNSPNDNGHHEPVAMATDAPTTRAQPQLAFRRSRSISDPDGDTANGSASVDSSGRTTSKVKAVVVKEMSLTADGDTMVTMTKATVGDDGQIQVIKLSNYSDTDPGSPHDVTTKEITVTRATTGSSRSPSLSSESSLTRDSPRQRRSLRDDVFLPVTALKVHSEPAATGVRITADDFRSDRSDRSDNSEPHQDHEETEATRQRMTTVLQDPWINHAEDILKAEVGPDEYRKRMDKQNRAFEDGLRRAAVTNQVPIYFMKNKIKSLFETFAKQNPGGRATHVTGVGALGHALIDKNPKIPDSDFFVPGRMFEIRARHANFPSRADDTVAAWRSLSLKFSDHEYESPLDLILQTGRYSPVFNADSAYDFHNALQKGPAAFKQFVLTYPINLDSTLEGLRKMPDSYYHQYYHSQMTYDFDAKDGKRRISRFRVIPTDGHPETGRLSAAEQKESWHNLILSGEDNSPMAYLRDEFQERVQESGATYRLQIQLHECQNGDSHSWFNPSLPWDDEVTPWLDLATIRLTTILPDDVTEMTRFNIGHMPRETLGYPAPFSNDDYNIVPYLREETYWACAKHRNKDPDNTLRGESVEYLLHVVTGNQAAAGNEDPKCDIYVCLVGTEGRTAYLELSRRVKTDFLAGGKCTFHLVDKYIGEFQCCKVFKERKGHKSDWFLEYMVVSTPYNNRCHTLPCYRWFTDPTPLIVLRDGRAQLSHNEDDYYMKRLRQFEVTARQQVFKWRDQDLDPAFKGFPGYSAAGSEMDDLPGDMRTDEIRTLLAEWSRHLDGKNSLLKAVRHFFKIRKSKVGQDYAEAVAENLENHEQYNTLQHVLRHWKDDEEFARQMLNGVLPLKISQLDEIPRNFQVTDAMVAGQLESGYTMVKALQDGRLFLISYEELEEFAYYDSDDGLASMERPPSTSPYNPAPSSSGSSSDSSDDEDPSHVAGSTHDVSTSSYDVSTGTPKAKKSKRKKPKKPKGLKKKATIKRAHSTNSLKRKKKKAADASGNTKYLCAPMVMLYLRGGTTLVPLAIQLTTTPGHSPVIFTKNDDHGEYSDWLVAKMWVRVAEANVHHLVGHVLGTHLMMEPVALATARNLPSVHPISKLLIPYLRTIVTVNTIYRKCVLQPEDGALAEVLALGAHGLDLIRREFHSYERFASFSLPDHFAARGTLDSEELPGYYYRDDVLKLWQAVEDFVTEVVCIYYEDDNDVEQDDELANMLEDLVHNGYHDRLDLPRRFTSLGDLVNFCTTVIFTVSAQHCALSRGMVDVYAYCLNAPPFMMRPPPRAKRPAGYTEEEMKGLLPQPDLAERYLGAVLLLTCQGKDNKVTLGQYPERIFTDETTLIAIKNFQNRLAQISEEIGYRNSTLSCAYDYLLPENIPVGIDV